MEWYRIHHALKGIGKYPQVKTATGDFNVNSVLYIGNSQFHAKEIEVEAVLPELVLWARAKLTDLISSSFMGTTRGLVVSNKLKIIIEKYQPASLQFFKLKIHHKGVVYDQYCICGLLVMIMLSLIFLNLKYGSEETL